jgi:eukaryotic-like serine/threonine-protein kinase
MHAAPCRRAVPANCSLPLLAVEAWDEAEALLRECLAIREKTEPDAWRTFNTRSLLGGALLGHKKLGEAEPFLLDGYRGMKEREASIPPPGAIRIPEALERIVKLYEAKGDAGEARTWRAKLDAARAAGLPVDRRLQPASPRATESQPSTRESK